MHLTPSSVVGQSAESHEPSASKFHSPLKKRQLHKLIPNLQEKLIDEQPVRPLKKRRLPVALFSSSTLDGLDVPDKLKPTVQAIEAYTQNLGHLVAAESQAKITAIVESQSLSLEEKEIELGLLYFYVTAHKNLPQELPLFTARLEEIEGEVLLLQEEYKLACPDNKEIPSGSLHYIQRAFFHMIFTEDGAFNTGGCLAVQKFLTQSRLSLLLTEEERNRILSTVTLLLEDEEFKDLFMQPLTLHPTLKRVISLDIKKSSKKSLSAIEIRWALLLQFFSLIGQTDEGNCYAVATYLNLQNEHPKVLLKMTIELFKSGQLEFEGVEIPVYLIMGNRLQWEADFKHECDPDIAYTLTPVVVAQNALGMQRTPKLNKSSESLDTLFPHAFGRSMEEAKQLFAAHKFNMVQQMMLSVFQFIAKNTSTHVWEFETPKIEIFRKLHEMYWDDLLEKLQQAGIAPDEEFNKFFIRFGWEVFKKMYFVDLRNWTFVQRDDYTIYDNHAVGLQIEDGDPKAEYLQFITRLYMHKEGNFLPVERISEFKTYMAECVDGAVGANPTAGVLQGASILKSFLSSFTFQLITSEWLEARNKLVNNPLKSDIYLKSDSFFLSAGGSSDIFITNFGPLQNTYSPRLAFQSTDLKNFFNNLCAHVRAIVMADPFYQTGKNHQILMSFPGHTFNLTPNRFSDYWESEEDLLDEKITQPARDLLARNISEKQKMRILIKFGGARAKITYSSTLSRPMSAKEFKEEILAQIAEEKQSQFKEAFNKGLQEIAYADFKAEATKLLEKLVRPLSTEEKAQVARYFEKNHKKLSFLSPYQAAKWLKKALLTLEKTRAISTHTLEQAIRESYGLPQVVPIANLNWVEKQSEHLKYHTLVIHQDLANEEIVLSKRVQGREVVFEHTASLISATGLIPNRP